MARLPQPGGDAGNWGVILNDYLSQSHAPDGSLKAGAVNGESVSDGIVTKVKLATGLQTEIDGKMTRSVADTLYQTKGATGRVTPLQTIAIYGDSLTESVGTNWPETTLASLSGLPVINLGKSGQGAADIITRQGGLSPQVTLAGGQIPAGTTPVTISTIDPSIGWRVNGSGTFGFTGTLADTPGQLVHDLVTDIWTFTRTTAGTAVTVPAASVFTRNEDLSYRNHLTILWAGRNNVSPNTLPMTRDLIELAITEGIRSHIKKYLVLGIINGQNEATGSSSHTLITSHNATLSTRYGLQFYDIRRDFIDDGLTIAGITPTTADTNAIAADTPPASLMSDTIHPNAAGYGVIARLVAEKIATLGWIPEVIEPTAPIQTLTSDSFDRANTSSGVLGTTDVAQGGTALAWTAEGQLQIISNRVGSTSLSAARRATVDVGVVDHHVKATLAITDGGLITRWTDGNNHYVARINSTNGAIAIDRRVGGAVTSLYESAAGAFQAGNTLGFSVKTKTVNGSTVAELKLYINEIELHTETDNNPITTGTRCGIRSAFSNTAYAIDNFVATTVA